MLQLEGLASVGLSVFYCMLKMTHRINRQTGHSSLISTADKLLFLRYLMYYIGVERSRPPPPTTLSSKMKSFSLETPQSTSQ